MKYVNMTCATKTFYGVEFKPGDVKDVPGFINVDGFFRTDINNVPDTGTKSEPKVAEQDKSIEEATPAEAPKEETTPKRTRKSKESES